MRRYTFASYIKITLLDYLCTLRNIQGYHLWRKFVRHAQDRREREWHEVMVSLEIKPGPFCMEVGDNDQSDTTALHYKMAITN